VECRFNAGFINRLNLFKMKNVWKWPGCILAIVLLSANSFSQRVKITDYENLTAKQNTRRELTTDTPLYPGTKPWLVDDIELSYPRVARKFARLFPGAINLQWFKEEQALFAYFFINGRKAYAVFTLQGRMNYVITSLEPADLPAGIAKKIISDYEQYSIFNIKQVLICGFAVYRIILENEYEFIQVQVADGDIEEVERLKKSLSRVANNRQ
jgi:hypothetical protein